MNVGFMAYQDQGKTISAVALVVKLFGLECSCPLHVPYTPLRMVGNLDLRIPGYTRLSDEELRKWGALVPAEEKRHYIRVFDEVDKVYPSRLFKSEAQTRELVGDWWLDEKLCMWNIWTAHLGVMVDKIIREATQIVCVPEFDHEGGVCETEMFNGVDGPDFDGLMVIERPDALYPLYDRWSLVT